MSSNPSTSSSGGGSSGGGGGGGGGGPCGACKFLRRKCVAGCIFAPHFDSDQGAAHFAAVHKVFGASNVSKLLLHLPAQRRHDAVVTICYEAQARLRDPIYGCVSHIFALQQQVVNLQAELAYFQAHLASLEGPTPPPPPPPHSSVPPPGLTINDLTTASSVLGAYDLSSLLEPMVAPPSWTMQPTRRQMDPDRQFVSRSATRSLTDLPPSQGGTDDLQELARELLHRPSRVSSGSVPCKAEHSSLPPHNG
ncbi:LOB domain-containing protein 30 [Cynara cardunculus var. scolymus]|uniref:Lateral organ boundaries domain-containing protein n=1 Tax=Cynara cardunculus var. scolymus TaxID=59895 RepID=A0A118JU94_CYNCS|nr:LOB domain-containing protein 30 [Cynara cardunculus var. scolymus]KVH91181.1 lateral organ boundaries domain-containing protein [Cynara cardunculus var. scolymus]